MSYTKPDCFVTIKVAPTALPVTTPTFFPTAIAPHFFVAKDDVVTDAGKDIYNGRQLDSINYPGLPNQTVDDDEKLLVDIGNLASNGIEVAGLPEIEQFGPAIYITTDNGQKVNISGITGVTVASGTFSIPANIVFNPDTGTAVSKKGDLADGNMADAGYDDNWEAVGAHVTLSKDSDVKWGSNTQSLKVTLSVDTVADEGVQSKAEVGDPPVGQYLVSPNEKYIAHVVASISSAQKSYKIVVFDVTNNTAITSLTEQNNTVFPGVPVALPFTVPVGCSKIQILVLTQSPYMPAGPDYTIYVGDIHLEYTGTVTEDNALKGSVSVSYRALEEKYTGDSMQILEAGTLEELIDIFGLDGIGPANPLGFMMYQMILNSGLKVRGIAVGNPANNNGTSSYTGKIDDEVMAYTTSIDFIHQTPEKFFGLAFATSNETVWGVVKTYLETIEGTKKYWARAVFGGKVPEKLVFRYATDGKLGGVLTTAAVLTNNCTITHSGLDYQVKVYNGVPYVPLPYATNQSNLSFVFNGETYSDGGYTIVNAQGVTYGLTSASAGDFTANGYRKVKLNDTVAIGAVIFKVLAVRSDLLILECTSATDEPGGADKTYTVFRYLTFDGTENGRPSKALIAEALRDRALYFNYQRISIMVPDWISLLVDNVQTDVESWYAAAQLAAEMCKPVNVVTDTGPGRPVGNAFTGLYDSISHAFKASRWFSEDQMDIIGGGGNLILVNDAPNTMLTSRHSLTTDMSCVEYQEICLGVARDYTAYMIYQTMYRLVKVQRVTEDLISILKMTLGAVRAGLIEDSVLYDLKFTSINTNTRPDFVNVEGDLMHIYPLNRLQFDLTVVRPVAFNVSL